MLSLFVTMHFNLVTDPPQVRYSKLTIFVRPKGTAMYVKPCCHLMETIRKYQNTIKNH